MNTSSQPIDASVPISAFPICSNGAVVPAEIDRLGLASHFPAVVELTRELFGDEFEVSVDSDPEIANWSQVVFSVRSSDSMAALLERNTQWHRRLPHATTEAQGAFCLSIDAQS
jgi:hypothetical protein